MAPIIVQCTTPISIYECPVPKYPSRNIYCEMQNKKGIGSVFRWACAWFHMCGNDLLLIFMCQWRSIESFYSFAPFCFCIKASNKFFSTPIKLHTQLINGCSLDVIGMSPEHLLSTYSLKSVFLAWLKALKIKHCVKQFSKCIKIIMCN